MINYNRSTGLESSLVGQQLSLIPADFAQLKQVLRNRAITARLTDQLVLGQPAYKLFWDFELGGHWTKAEVALILKQTADWRPGNEDIVLARLDLIASRLGGAV